MSHICIDCGAKAVENYCAPGATEQLLCTNCGVVSTEGIFTDNVDGTSFVSNAKETKVKLSIPNVTRAINYSEHTRIPDGKKLGLNLIDTLALHFKLSPDLVNRAKKMFLNAYEDNKSDIIPLKKILAGCCVFAVLREIGRTVVLSSLCYYLECDHCDFVSFYKDLDFPFQQDLLYQSIEELVPQFLGSFPSNERELLKTKTLKIIRIAEHFWLVTGRSSTSIIAAAMFIAWKSLDMSRKCARFGQFYKQYSFPISLRTASKRASELVSVLCKVSEELPFFSSGLITANNLSVFLDKLLEYTDLACHLFSSKYGKDQKQCEDLEMKKYMLFRKRRKGMNCNSEQNTEIVIDGDRYISDSEVEQCIRRPEEIAFIAKLKSEFCDDSENNTLKSQENVTSLRKCDQNLKNFKIKKTKTLNKVMKNCRNVEGKTASLQKGHEATFSKGTQNFNLKNNAELSIDNNYHVLTPEIDLCIRQPQEMECTTEGLDRFYDHSENNNSFQKCVINPQQSVEPVTNYNRYMSDYETEYFSKDIEEETDAFSNFKSKFYGCSDDSDSN